ncbi:MAG TPA: hypothetical protein VFM18_05840, partial [Methanosarcina sp.]|nr:hypothetical protein [Methanosarcina sp.]
YKRKYGISITRIKPRKTFKDWYLGIVTRGEMEGQVRGTPLITAPCYWRREAKEISFNDWIKAEGITEFKKYVGYVFHEYDRWKDIDKHDAIAPLVDWKWNENEVRAYLRENMIENKLYQHFDRTGCAICPKQSDAFYNVYRYYPKHWEQAKQIEKEVYDLRAKRGEEQRPSYHTEKFSWELEKDFKRKDMQMELELDFDPPQDCFCKI